MAKAQQVGKRIAQARREKAVREQRDVRPVDMARALGVSGAAVSDWEAGKATPRDDALERLAKFLGVTPEYLRYGVTSTNHVHTYTAEELAHATREADKLDAVQGKPAKGSAKKASRPARGRAAGGRG